MAIGQSKTGSPRRRGDAEKNLAFNGKGRRGREGREKPLKHRGTEEAEAGKNYRGLARMNADYFLGGSAAAPSAALFIGLGILLQGELQQPMDGLSAGFKAMGKAEVVKLFQQLLFQAQVNKRRQLFPRHRQEYTRDA